LVVGSKPLNDETGPQGTSKEASKSRRTDVFTM
jgi:hypothetical protein